MKRVFATLSQKWPEYLLEILVLIIGIYGAFAVDSWSEDRKDRQAQQELLGLVINDLKSRQTEANSDLSNGNEILAKTEKLLSTWEKSQTLDTIELKSTLKIIGFDMLMFIKASPVYSSLSDSQLWKDLPDSLTTQIDDLYKNGIERVNISYLTFNEYSTHRALIFLGPNDLLDLDLTNAKLLQKMQGKEEEFILQTKTFVYGMKRLLSRLEEFVNRTEEVSQKLKAFQKSQNLTK